MKHFSSWSVVLAVAAACLSCAGDPQRGTDFTAYVDPMIGTGYHGHVFLGASVPFGAVQTGPVNYIKGWDWCSGYHYSDSIITGFSQLHLSGTGIGDLGDILITPFTGKVKTSPGTADKPLSGYASRFSHADEQATTGYYAVRLKDFDILAELTATERVAFHRYTFPSTREAHIAINLAEGIGWDQPAETFIRRINPATWEGYRFSTGWAKDQRVFFVIQTSCPVEKFELFDNDLFVPGDSARSGKLTGILTFGASQDEPVLLKIAISPVSCENAMANLQGELPEWNFEEAADAAKQAWNRELGKIRVKGKDVALLRTFYTALFHSYIHPALFCDSNGDYRGADGKAHPDQGFRTYSVFSLWDTYRAAHPLFTLTQPERVNDMVNTMLTIYKQQGKLPVWHLMGNETDCMVGYSAVPIIADAWFKGFRGIDAKLAFEAMKVSSSRDDYGVGFLKEKGFIPADKERESVSKALEYCISDWCIAQMALALGKMEDYEYYSKRATFYQQYFDPVTHFMRAKLDNGKFREPFSPFQSIHEWGDYTEGNAWQYTWLVPHDVEGLIRLFGGDGPFLAKLDSLFVVEGDMGEKASADISGLIGQYAHGNEPSHHIAYLYAYAGQQWKTAEKARSIMQALYSDKPDGLCGNEDCGQMSAWYILSALGLYPVNPANGVFVFGSPLFDEAALMLPHGKSFVVKALNISGENLYIQSAMLNDKPYTKSYITYRQIIEGGHLVFEMGPSPNAGFGSDIKDRPFSAIPQ
jgi:predicted alpha-1,2-mannosidase